MRLAIAVMAAVLVLASGCLKTQEKLITHFDICEDQKKLADPEDYRDPYDSCLMEQEDYVKSEPGCKKLCMEFCERQDEDYSDRWVDFSGCHCLCKRRIS